jgi:hypothetical protein
MATSAIDTAHQTACVMIVGTPTYYAGGNMLRNNTYSAGSASTVIINTSTGGKNFSQGDRFQDKGIDTTSPWISISSNLNGKPSGYPGIDGAANQLIVTAPVNGTNVKIGLASDLVRTTTTNAKIPFNTVAWDERGEYSSGAGSILVNLPGYYRVTIVLYSTTWTAGVNSIIRLNSGSFASPTQLANWIFEGPTNGKGSPTFTTEVFISGNNTEIHAALEFVSTPSTTIVASASYMLIEKI